MEELELAPPFHFHDLERVGGGAGSGTQLIIKDQLPLAHVVAKVQVVRVGRMVGEMRELEVVGGDQPRAVRAKQRMDVGAAADQPFAIVRAAKNLVNEIKQRQFIFCLQLLQ